jgi:hypothetical protein
MEVISLAIPLAPRRVRTLATFEAPDPWHGGAPARFAIDLYRILPKGSAASPENSLWSGKEVCGIRSEEDGGQEHMLPEALTELWRTDRVPAHLLPRLLAGIQPTLRRTDFAPLLRMRVHRPLAAVLAALAMVCLALAIATGLGAAAAPVISRVLAALALLAAAGAGAVYLMIAARQARRRKQMAWLLARMAEQ